jgi:hypothetical protein
MMNSLILSLFFCTATVTGRLRHFESRKQEELQKTRANETFFAKNEIVPTMVAIENEKVAPFELVNVTDSNVTVKDGRYLQSLAAGRLRTRLIFDFESATATSVRFAQKVLLSAS